MPRKEGVSYLTTSMSEDAQNQVKEFSKSLGYRSTADYVRGLIEQDMKARGQAIDFGLTEWGKGREKKDDTGSGSELPAADQAPPRKRGNQKTES